MSNECPEVLRFSFSSDHEASAPTDKGIASSTVRRSGTTEMATGRGRDH